MIRTNDWNDWYLFVQVANLGSFTRAAELLDAPKSSVSTAVSRLERRIGVRLLERSTRHLRLTEAGQRLLQDAAPLFSRLEDVADHLHGQIQAPLSGLLRVAAPYEFAHLRLNRVVCELLERHSQLRIEVDVTRGLVDPLASGYDVCFVLSNQKLPDSGLTMRRLYDIEYGVYAAPSLLVRLGRPEEPEALNAWPLAMTSDAFAWLFRHEDGREVKMEQEPRLTTPNGSLRLGVACAGQVAAALPAMLAEEACKAGLLVPLLPEWRLPPLRIYALLPSRTLVPTKTRALLDALKAEQDFKEAFI